MSGGNGGRACLSGGPARPARTWRLGRDGAAQEGPGGLADAVGEAECRVEACSDHRGLTLTSLLLLLLLLLRLLTWDGTASMRPAHVRMEHVRTDSGLGSTPKMTLQPTTSSSNRKVCATTAANGAGHRPLRLPRNPYSNSFSYSYSYSYSF